MRNYFIIQYTLEDNHAYINKNRFLDTWWQQKKKKKKAVNTLTWLLAHSCAITYPTEKEQPYHSFGVVFVFT